MDVSPSPSMAQFLINAGTGGTTTGQENSPSNKWPKCTKTYNSRWETDPLLKTWIARHPGDNGKVVCRFCQSVIRAHKNDLLEHTRTLKHQRNFMAHTTPEEYNQFVMELNELRKDAQVVTTKKKTGSSTGSTNGNKSHHHHHQSSRDLNNSTSNSSWTLCKSPNVSSLDSSGGGGGVNQIELWSAENNDSYMSAADSPSDLVSVVLEEQPFLEQRASPQGSLNSNESNSSISALTSSSASQPVTMAMAIAATTIPLLHHHSTNSNNSNNNNNGNSSGGGTSRSKHETSPFTCQDVISAIEDNFFSLSELVALAKSALGQIECSVNNRATSADVKLFNSNNSSPSHKFPKNGGKQLLKAKDILIRRKR